MTCGPPPAPARGLPAARPRVRPGPDRRVCLGPDLARLPGPVDPPARLGHRRFDLCLHDDPDDLPDRPGARVRWSSTSFGRGSRRSTSWRSVRSSSRSSFRRDGHRDRARASRSPQPHDGLQQPVHELRPAGRARRPAGDVRDGPDLPGGVGPRSRIRMATSAANSGLLLSANTLGAITGTFLIPFVVIPLVGSPVALGLIAVLNAGDGRRSRRRWTRSRIDCPRLLTGRRRRRRRGSSWS